MAESRIDELRRRLDRDPGSRLFAQLAEEYRKAGSHADAIRVARSGLAQHPSYPSARLTLGRALLDSGDPAGARAELEAVLKEAPDNILASRFLGQALEALGELAPALEQLQRTLKMAPGDRQLESQIVSLQTRLRSPQSAAAWPPRPAPPTTAPSAHPPATPAAPWNATPPTMPRAAAAAASGPEAEAPPPTIRIRPPGDPAAWAPKAAVPPPLPATAAPTAATPAGPPPLRGAVSPAVVTEKLPAFPSGVYESDFAPTIPPVRRSTLGLADETAVPTLPPGAIGAEETVLEAEAPFGSAPGPIRAETQPRPEPRLVPELPLPLPEARARKEPLPPAEAPRPERAAVAKEPAPSAEPGAADAGEAAGTPFSSSTLAELYLKQGLADRAIDVYRQVLAGEPGNERARARLAEIERMPPPDTVRADRRRALERTIAGLEALLAVVQRR